nr:uncharacterized protein LOC125418353 [Ziziphus jujuba var. spinosa]
MGGKIDSSVNRGRGPPVFRLHGQNYHKIGSLLPPEGSLLKFAQLYIYDTENEVSNRIQVVSQNFDIKKLHTEIVHDLMMLDEHNVLVKSFRMVRDTIRQHDSSNLKLRFIGRREGNGRMYNLPIVLEVATLVVGDFETFPADRDIIVETQTRELKRINELNASYLGLQYPLLFPYGQDGYRKDVPLKQSDTKSSARRKRLSMREFFAYRLQERDNESPDILFSKRLFQQFLVDAYTMVESSRLSYICTHKKELRSEMYRGLAEAILKGGIDASSQGKCFILPSSFTGGARYMIQNYQDAMAICKWAGYPELFITLTCNPKWPEVVRFVESRGLRPEDRAYILCRIFKVKLDQLVKDLRQNKIFGKAKADEDIDKIISAEIPDEVNDPEYYAAIKNLMMHGPCGNSRKNSLCMLDGRCTKHFLKRYVDCITVDEDGYPIYRRRDNGRTIEKNGTALNNRYVVPHNRYLLLKYGAHMNVEWCNQSRTIKYLFKYVNKGHDRVTVTFYGSANDSNVHGHMDEINMYYDCRMRLHVLFENLLNIVQGPRNFEDIMNINGIQYNSLRDACYALGLLDDDKEYVDDSLTKPEFVWEQSWRYLSDDILYRQRNILHHQDLHLTDEEIKNYTLIEIEEILRSNGKSLRDFPMMHFPGTIDVFCRQNRLIQDELRYDRIALAEDHNKFVSNLTAEQKSVYETIMGAVEGVKPSIFFMYGYGDSTCNIKQDSPPAELIVKTELIIWDEAPMMNRYCFEVLDMTMRDILRFSNPLSLEQPFGVLKLTKNMRLQSIDSDIDKDELKAFSEWISSIGDGTIGGLNDGHAMIDIPDDLLIKDTEDSATSIVNSMYPFFLENINDPSYLQERAILALTLDIVESIMTTVPNHQLKLKVDVLVMLLRNVDHSLGLCNGTRLIITRLGNHVLEGKVISGSNAGFKVFIPRITLTPSDPRLRFKFKRRQYPLLVSYSMTINESQGQSLSHVGLFHKRPVFSHGQLYIAVSRVTNRK